MKAINLIVTKTRKQEDICNYKTTVREQPTRTNISKSKIGVAYEIQNI